MCKRSLALPSEVLATTRPTTITFQGCSKDRCDCAHTSDYDSTNVRRPERPVLTTNSPFCARHHPLLIRTTSPDLTIFTCSPQRTIPTMPVSSLPTAEQTIPEYLALATTRRGYLRRMRRSRERTKLWPCKSTTFCSSAPINCLLSSALDQNGCPRVLDLPVMLGSLRLLG